MTSPRRTSRSLAFSTPNFVTTASWVKETSQWEAGKPFLSGTSLEIAWEAGVWERKRKGTSGGRKTKRVREGRGGTRSSPVLSPPALVSLNSFPLPCWMPDTQASLVRVCAQGLSCSCNKPRVWTPGLPTGYRHVSWDTFVVWNRESLILSW